MSALLDPQFALGSIQMQCSVSSIKQVVRDHLVWLTQSPVASEQVRERSYVHALGFFKMVLWQGDEEKALRLHYWKANTPWSDVHNHRYDFSSKILLGELRIKKWEPAKLGNETITLEALLESSNITDKQWKFAPLGRRAFVERESILLRSGKSYRMTADRFHQVAATAGTISVVTQGAAVRSYSIVAKRTLGADTNSEIAAQSRPTEEEFFLLIESILGLLR